MKNFLILISIFASAVMVTSCDCRGPFGGARVECSNGGTCNDGECDCLKGYFGTNCTDVDSCELLDVYCERGECIDGSCLCDAGWEGDSCDTESRRKFIGYYAVTESCIDLDTLGGYNIWIERNALNGESMYIFNLFNYENFPINGYFSKIEAIAESGTSGFNIPNQRPDGGQKSIRGSGTITIDSANTSLNILYTTVNGGKTYECSLTGVLIPNPL
ncbi:MAG: hypothetical protein Salg2KO_18230 [Salibacteraceae bacterium]